MTKCTEGELSFGRIGRLAVQAAFDGGDMGSDGGALLLRRVDERLGLCRRAAAVLAEALAAAALRKRASSAAPSDSGCPPVDGIERLKLELPSILMEGTEKMCREAEEIC